MLATGIPVRPVFEGLRRDGGVRASLGLRESSPTVMVFGGGGGYGPMEAATKACLWAGDWQVVVVCGHNEKLRRKLVPLAQAVPERLRVLGYRRDVPQLMCASEAVVTKGGGLSLTESLYSGARTIAMPSLPGQELVNLAFMESRGWVEVCGDVRNLAALLQEPGDGRGHRSELPPRPAKAAACALDELARRGRD